MADAVADPDDSAEELEVGLDSLSQAKGKGWISKLKADYRLPEGTSRSIRSVASSAIVDEPGLQSHII